MQYYFLLWHGGREENRETSSSLDWCCGAESGGLEWLLHDSCYEVSEEQKGRKEKLNFVEPKKKKVRYTRNSAEPTRGLRVNKDEICPW